MQNFWCRSLHWKWPKLLHYTQPSLCLFDLYVILIADNIAQQMRETPQLQLTIQNGVYAQSTTEAHGKSCTTEQGQLNGPWVWDEPFLVAGMAEPIPWGSLRGRQHRSRAGNHSQPVTTPQPANRLLVWQTPPAKPALRMWIRWTSALPAHTGDTRGNTPSPLVRHSENHQAPAPRDWENSRQEGQCTSLKETAQAVTVNDFYF